MVKWQNLVGKTVFSKSDENDPIENGPHPPEFKLLEFIGYSDDLATVKFTGT